MRFESVPDYHMHTPRCNHATGNVMDYCQAALNVGLKEIGMSDHSPMPGGFDAAWRMANNELPDYLAEVENARDTLAGRLDVRIGIEADFHPGTENAVSGMIQAYAWDYVIGSVHYIGDWAFDNPDELARWKDMDVEQAYCDYFELVGQSALSGMFDVIGHPDLIKKFGQRPPEGSIRVEMAENAMLESVLASGAALEISSAGLRKPVGEIYPQARIVHKAAKLGIPFAFGSDAHAPGEVGHGMDECLTMLVQAGVQSVVAFQQRQRRDVLIQAVS
ncbi:MAG: histidinol phosphatase [Zetaproteobacteria bacterium CG1_02_49_23]|nr:MAG: histidinol phosphatase [Zetaproteobacteria bacterium CG1_02_49_23]